MDHDKPKLTAGELGYLWDYLMDSSLSAVILEYFYRTTESESISSICLKARNMVEQDKEDIRKVLDSEKYPLPKGFTKTDINADAKKPFTDVFVLFFVHHMAQADLSLTSMMLANCVREDLRQLFRSRITKAAELYDDAVTLMLKKGVFVRSPLVTSTHEANPDAKEGFLASFISADPRPLTAREANELHRNIINNHIGKSLLMGLHQSNKNDDLKRLLLRGKELSSKIINECSAILTENDLPIAMSWDTHVLDSTESPFSDRLIAFLLNQLNKIGLANYGFAFAMSPRKDLKTLYTTVIADVYQYELDTKRLMIENQWMERPPLSLDRKKLAAK